jgi:hypothetical protein
MATVCKGTKTKGGKPVVGASAVDAAAVKNAEGVAAFMADPRLFSVFTVMEDVGVSKKEARQDYVLKGIVEGGGVCSVFVPAAFLTKNGKLALRDMGVVGRRLAVSSKMVTVQRTTWRAKMGGGGCMMTGPVTEMDHIVSALLP